MLTLPQDSRPYRIVGIDPGTDTMGVAAIEVDLATRSVTLVEVQTLNGTQSSREYPNMIQVHGNLSARLWAHEQSLYGYFKYFEPHSVIAESPFMRKFPQAYAALTLCMNTIQRALHRFDPFIPLLTVDPPTVKLVVGVKGKGTTKDDVARGLMKLAYLQNPYNIDISSLDEHSVDAIVVALVRAEYILSQL